MRRHEIQGLERRQGALDRLCAYLFALRLCHPRTTRIAYMTGTPRSSRRSCLRRGRHEGSGSRHDCFRGRNRSSHGADAGAGANGAWFARALSRVKVFTADPGPHGPEFCEQGLIIQSLSAVAGEKNVPVVLLYQPNDSIPENTWTKPADGFRFEQTPLKDKVRVMMICGRG